MDKFASQKTLMRSYMEQMEKCSPEQAAATLSQFTSDDYSFEGSYPFMDIDGADAVCQKFWQPLKTSLKHLQRRQDVFMAGIAEDDKTWVMSMGQFMGLFDESFLGLEPTYKMQHLPYTEFACIEDGKISHSGLFVDLIAFMQEAGLRPLLDETGHFFRYTGPRDHNGLLFEASDPKQGEQSLAIVNHMLTALYGEKATDPKAMQEHWADDMIWYGPCGVGASYTIPRYQLQHQKPFRDNLSNRSRLRRQAYFAEGDFVCFYADLKLDSDGGWLGMAGGAKDIVLRADLDVYYCKDGKISENWCYFDIPYWLYQQGIDILQRVKQIKNPIA